MILENGLNQLPPIVCDLEFQESSDALNFNKTAFAQQGQPRLQARAIHTQYSLQVANAKFFREEAQKGSYDQRIR